MFLDFLINHYQQSMKRRVMLIKDLKTISIGDLIDPDRQIDLIMIELTIN